MVKIVPGNDRLNIYDGNVIVGYVEGETLFGIDKDGYAEEIGRIDHQNEIEQRLNEWRNRPN